MIISVIFLIWFPSLCQSVTTVTKKGLLLFLRRGVHCGADLRGPAGELTALG